MTGYIGIGGTAKKIKNIYIGVNGVAKQVKKAYIGVGGVAKQWYSSISSLGDLLANHRSNVIYAYGSTSATRLNIAATDPAAVGDTWFSFLFVGGCLAITRVDVQSGGNSILTPLNTITAEGATEIAAETSGTAIRCTSSVYGVHIGVKFDSAYTAEAISQIIENAEIECVKWYYNTTASSNSTTSDNTRIALATVTQRPGYIFTAFPEPYSSSEKASYSLSKSATPLTRLWSVTDGASRSYPALVQKTVSNVDYLFPSFDNSNIARTRSYSLFNLKDD